MEALGAIIDPLGVTKRGTMRRLLPRPSARHSDSTYDSAIIDHTGFEMHSIDLELHPQKAGIGDMANRRAGNKLNRKEVALVKAMINRGGFIDQTIQSYFSRPTRTINHARIKDIRDETKHATVRPASDKELDQFLATWPNVDPETGLAIQGDERLIKAREAMLCAVQNFNSGGLYFR